MNYRSNGKSRLGWPVLLAALACGKVWAAQAPDNIDFSFQIRPILADRCFKCHGPDEKARKGKLRLDLAESAYQIRDAEKKEAAVVPFHPERSQLCWRISATNEDDRMPPADSGLTLTDEEKASLKRWIQQGGVYQPHWAFRPVGKRELPKPADGLRPRNGVDAFVRARLDREGLKPAPAASQETLIRRLSFDLRGLPPSLEEMDAFLTDASPNAYERLVDRMLASPAYGEEQAALWLDLARFADTYGYQNDVERDMSPWRDWVIRAFNENLPYDKFITWQLAGDLLPQPTREQVLATAFNRLHRQTNEGGSIDDEFRAEYVADRVATTGTAFLGLTVGCARCHDHKYDPITQKEFYQMGAFFNNIDESGTYSHFTHATPSPGLLLYPKGLEAKHQALEKEMAAKEKAVVELQNGAHDRFEQWLGAGPRSIPKPEPATAYSFETIQGGSTPDSMSTNRAAGLVDGPVQAEGRVGKALKFSGDNSVVCKGVGVFHRTTPFSFSLWLKPTEKQERAVVFHRSRAWTDSGSRGYELVLENGVPTFSLVHFWPGNAIQVRAKSELPTNQWSHVAITYDGSSRAAGVQLYLNGERVPQEVERDHLFKDIIHRGQWGDFESENIELTLAGRFRDSGFKEGLIDEFEVFDRCLAPGEIKLDAGAPAGAPDRNALFAWYIQNVDAPTRTASVELEKLREAEDKLISDVPEIMVMSEMTPRRPTYLLKRGAYDAQGEEVEPGTLEKIFPFAEDLSRNRLGLAKWLVDPRNPLTARVAVNRVWRSHFGRGLVETEEDLGTQGRLPTHPELLDWLAANFMASGWDVKGLHKLIVMSETYRQASKASSELVARDPENRLLARGPKHRLRAEEIRDNALAVSGLLSHRIGGPSAKPYQPPGLWEEAGTGKSYAQDSGEGLYRRSLYTFWKRTSPPPSMLIFDAPSREVCTARRDTTSTPLQALVLLNDPQYVEAARALAEELVRHCGSDVEACIERGFRRVIGRPATAAEMTVLRKLYQEQLKGFEADSAAAEKYLKTGARAFDKNLLAPQVAAMAMVAGAIINLDEFVTLR